MRRQAEEEADARLLRRGQSAKEMEERAQREASELARKDV